MTWAVLFILLLGVPLLMAAARYFNDLEPDLLRWLLSAAGAGAAAMLTARLIAPGRTGVPVAGAAIGIACHLLGRHLRELDPADGLVTGGVVASGAAIPLAFAAHRPLVDLSASFVGAPMAGVVAAAALARGLAPWASWPMTIAAGAAGAGTGALLARAASPATVASAAAATVFLVALAAPIVRWRTVREELDEEATLGLMPHELVAHLAHPVRRHFRGRTDADAHRRLVQLGWMIALQKRRQRALGPDEARLQQLEILKLRMEFSSVLAIARQIELGTGEEGQPSARIEEKGSPAAECRD